MTSISAPTSLATFSQPHASSSKIPHVTLAPVKGRENLAVAAVQGDGIWTYDLTTLRPTTTFTVPPNTTFSTPPISFYPSSRYPFKSSGKQKAEELTNTDPASLNDIGEDSRLERITVAGVSKGEKVRLEEEGRVLWVWKSEEGIKSSIILDHVVQMIHHVSHHRAHVICVSTHGHITALDSTFQIRPVTLSTYLPNIIASRILSVIGTLVRIALLNDKGEVNVVEIDISGPREMNGQIVKKGDLLEDIKAPQIVSAEIGADGVINIHLGGRKDIFISRSIKSIGSNEKSSLGSHLVHTLTTSPLPLSSAGRPVSLVAVREPELSLLIVSSFGHVTAVLTVSSLTSIAPVADATVSHLSIVSSSAPGSFIIAVTLAYNGESGSRTAIHTVEVNLPMNGIGMNLLLGSQKATLEHFVPHVQQSQKSTSFETFISTFTDKLAKNEGLASFEKYLKNEENGFTAMGKPITVYQMSDGHVKSVLGAVLNSATKKQAGGSEKIDQESKVVNMLTKRLWVNDEMYSGGVLNTLIALKDWDNAYRMVRTVQTIPSESIVKFIKISISNEGNPTLENVLREILANPIPAPDYRNALRQFLSVEEATLVIEVYSKWLSVHVEKRNEALNGWTEILPESNVLKKGRLIKPKEPVNVSSLHALINHSSVILDSHLPLFLSHPPSYDILQSLQDQLEPLLTLQESYRKLRAPVEAVLTLSRREARKNEEQEKKREVVRLNTNANPSKEKGKKMVGLPDEAVGKWRVEEFIF